MSTISVIIPVLNEAETINGAIEDLFRQRFEGGIEVIVVDGSLRGDTAQAIAHKDVIKIVSEKGRGKQMNRGASAATGDTLLFLHADTALPVGALSRIVSLMENGRYVAGAFDLAINSVRPVFRIIERMASLRARILRVPFGDQAIFVRRAYFEEIGGYPDIPLMEDVELMKEIKRRGGNIHIISGRVNTSPRRWENEGALYCTLRNWIIRALYSLGVSAEKLARFYK
jgi:rSAM/selenodomain-associated transferase 2